LAKRKGKRLAKKGREDVDREGRRSVRNGRGWQGREDISRKKGRGWEKVGKKGKGKGWQKREGKRLAGRERLTVKERDWQGREEVDREGRRSIGKGRGWQEKGKRLAGKKEEVCMKGRCWHKGMRLAQRDEVHKKGEGRH